MKAHLYTPDGGRQTLIEEIPAALAGDAKEAHEKLVEMIAEGDDEMMEEFSAKAPSHHDSSPPSASHVAEKILPRPDDLRLRNIGTASLLTFLAVAFPHPDEHAQVGFKDPGGKAIASSASTTTPSRLPLCLQTLARSFRRAVSTTSRLRADPEK